VVAKESSRRVADLGTGEEAFVLRGARLVESVLFPPPSKEQANRVRLAGGVGARMAEAPRFGAVQGEGV